MKVCQLYVANKETGTFIEPVENIAEGLNIISEFEKDDKEEGIFKPDFYDIVSEDHCSVLFDEVIG